MNKRKIPSLVTLAIITTVTIVIWVGYEVYKSFLIRPEVDIPSGVLMPFEATLNTDLLAEIEQRVYFERGESRPFSIVEIQPETIEIIESTTSSGFNFEEAGPATVSSEPEI